MQSARTSRMLGLVMTALVISNTCSNTAFCAQATTKSWGTWLKERQGYFLTAAASIGLTAVAMTLRARTNSQLSPQGKKLDEVAIRLLEGDIVAKSKNYSAHIQSHIFSITDCVGLLPDRATTMYTRSSNTPAQRIRIITLLEPIPA